MTRARRAHRPHFSWRCLDCGRTYDALRFTCPACGGMIDVDYELARFRLGRSEDPLVRYRGLLPVVSRTSVPGAALPRTPCVHARALGRALGLTRLYLKDETLHDTGTTKDRAAAVALACLAEAGVDLVCVSSTGNNSTAYARMCPVVRSSGGTFVAVTARAIGEARRLVAELEGLDACPASAAAVTGRELPPEPAARNLLWLERHGAGGRPEGGPSGAAAAAFDHPTSALGGIGA